jgi:hypothetical protein
LLAALFTVSTTPLLPLLLAVGREFRRAVLRVRGLVLRLDPLRDAAAVLLRDAAVFVPEDFLAPELFRAVVLAELLDRVVPVLGVLAAIFFVSPPTETSLSAGYPFAAAKTQCARTCIT